MEDANRFLYDAMLVHSGLRDMGTTIAGVLVTTDTVTVFHVGDSRVYLHVGDSLTQVTVDDWNDGYIIQTLGGIAGSIPSKCIPPGNPWGVGGSWRPPMDCSAVPTGQSSQRP